MKLHTLPLAAGLLGLSVAGAAAQSISCGGDYTVVRGDTLAAIGLRAYSDAGGWRLIYSVNRNVIGSNPGLIEVGQVYTIPCLDEEPAVATADTQNIRREETTEALPAPLPGGIRFLTGTNWAPYLDEDQEQGGMITEVVNTAMGKVATPDDYQIDFINDWSAHLRPLLTDNAYDLGFAWFRPNCELVDRLGPDSQFRCNNFDWSEPVFEQIVGYFTMTSFTAPLSHSDLIGKTLCRPSGYAVFMLEENGLIAPDINLVRPVDPADCFEGMISGEIDVTVLAVDVAEGLVREMPEADQITRQDALDQITTLHVITSKNNPRGLDYMAQFNEGLNELKDSGEWFSIVRRHLAEFRLGS